MGLREALRYEQRQGEQRVNDERSGRALEGAASHSEAAVYASGIARPG